MVERWLGITVSSEAVTVVDAEVPGSGPIVVQADQIFPLQSGPRSEAYWLLHQRISSYARDHRIARAIVRGSALSQGGAKLALLESAEVRGVVIGALASATRTHVITKQQISRTFGSRKFSEYVKDSDYWHEHATGKTLRVGSRDAALMILAGRGNE